MNNVSRPTVTLGLVCGGRVEFYSSVDLPLLRPPSSQDPSRSGTISKSRDTRTKMVETESSQKKRDPTVKSNTQIVVE